MKMYSRAQHMLVSGRGKWWKEVLLAMFTIYVDDSGTAPEQKIAIASALIVPAKRIVSFDREWDALKKEEGFSCLHTAEFAYLNSHSEFANWGDIKQHRVATRISHLAKKYGMRAFSFAVNKDDYDSVVPIECELRELCGKYHYTWAIRHTLKFVDEWAKINSPQHPLEYVFDWMKKTGKEKEKRDEIEAAMSQAEWIAGLQGRPGSFEHYSFRKRCELAPLQCADVLAWTCYQHALLEFRDKAMHSIAQKFCQDFARYRGKTWLTPVTVTRANLQIWKRKQDEDGKTLERFRIWKTQQSNA